MDRRLFGKVALGLTAFGSVVSSAFSATAKKVRPKRRNKDISKIIDPNLAKFSPDTAQEQMKVIQAKRYVKRNGKEGVCTSLLFFADVHLVTEHSSKIRKFYEKYQKFIDDPIHLGDTAGAFFREPFTTWDAFPRALNVIGNHDVYLTADAKTHMPDRRKYDTYFKKYNADWKVVLPENAEAEGKCYWHKDYNGDLRVIGVDCMRYDDVAQLEWFKKTLSDAIEKKLKVLIATHIPPNCDKLLECNFTTLDYDAWEKKSKKCDAYVEAIDEFIGAGGTFVCWMCGHLHHDQIMYTKGTKHKQLVIAMECATQFSDHTDGQHIRETATETCWQLVAIESESNVLKIARFGNCYDHYLRRKDTFCYDFKNHKIIWSS
ncbi:MAG: hypothetical protein E7036_07145 [Opitutales bacterium]|nr:hypothetical protein [Opitutales bacterium]